MVMLNAESPVRSIVVFVTFLRKRTPLVSQSKQIMFVRNVKCLYVREERDASNISTDYWQQTLEYPLISYLDC